MKRESLKSSRYEPYLLAFLPLLGIALVVIHQMGRYSFYSVSFEFLEIDTVKILISALSLGLFGTAAIYSLSLLYDSDYAKTPATHYLSHLAAAAFLTAPFWADTLNLKSSLSIPTITFITFASVVTFFIEKHIRKSGAASPELSVIAQMAAHAGILFWGTLLVTLATFAHGYLKEDDLDKRVFVEGTNYLFVGRVSGQLVLKEYEPASKKFIDGRTILMQPGVTTVLVERKAEIEK